MSTAYDPRSDHRNLIPWLDDTVEFDGPYGEHMTGEVVRASSGQFYHVMVDGVRYEVDSLADNMEKVFD